MIRWVLTGCIFLTTCTAILGQDSSAPSRPDALPPGALARLGTLQLRHGGRIEALALSPDGKLLASGGRDETIRLWDPATGKEIRTLSAKGASSFQPHALAFSADGKILVSGDSANLLRLWDVAEGRELRSFGYPQERLTCLSLAPSSRTVWTGGMDGIVREWMLATGLQLRQFKAHRGPVLALAHAPDGKQLFSLGSETPYQKPLRVVGEESKRLGECSVRTWDLTQGIEDQKPQHSFAVALGILSSTPWAFSADGQRVGLMGQDGILQVFDVKTGKALRQTFDVNKRLGTANRLSSLAFAPGGKVVAGVGQFGGIQVLGVSSGQELRRFDLPRHPGRNPIVLGANGKLLACATENAIHLWDPVAGREIVPESGHQGAIRSLIYSLDGKQFVSAGNEHTVRWWEPATGKQLARLDPPPSASIRYAATGASHTLFVAQTDKVLHVRPGGQQAQELNRFHGFKTLCQFLAASPDGKYLAVIGLDPFVWIFDARTGRVLAKLGENMKAAKKSKAISPLFPRPNAIVFSPHGDLAAVNGNFPVQVWNLKTGKLIREIAGTDNEPRMCFSPNGYTLALEYLDLRLVELVTGQDRLLVSDLFASSLAFSPDGAMLLAGTAKGKVKLLETATGHEKDQLSGHIGDVHALAAAADGRTFVSGAADTTILVWDAKLLVRRGKPALTQLERSELDLLWKNLADADARKGHQAIWSLTSAARQSIPYLKERLRPADPLPIAQLVAELDSADFQVRNKAHQALEMIGDLAEPALTEALAKKPPLEMRRRIEQLLPNLQKPSTQKIQLIRALEVLEYAANPEARQILAALAQGAPGHWLTVGASQALERLGRLD